MNLRAGQATDIEAIARTHAERWRAAYRGQYSDDFLDGPSQ